MPACTNTCHGSADTSRDTRRGDAARQRARVSRRGCRGSARARSRIAVHDDAARDVGRASAGVGASARVDRGRDMQLRTAHGCGRDADAHERAGREADDQRGYDEHEDRGTLDARRDVRDPMACADSRCDDGCSSRVGNDDDTCRRCVQCPSMDLIVCVRCAERGADVIPA